MNKGPLVLVSLATVLLVAGTTLIYVSDKAKPGDPLYTVDRSSEAISLALKKSTSKLAYGRLNLILASERLDEMKALKETLPVTQMGINKVSAQSQYSTKLDEYLAVLLADIVKNLNEAQDILTQLPQIQQQKLSLEIANSTTKYGQELTEITKDLTEESVNNFDEVIKKIEDIDSNAVDSLASIEDETPEKETEDEQEIGETLADKLETKLLKLREQQRIYSLLLDKNKSLLLPADAARATLLLDEIATELATAETQLSTQAFKAVADILDKTADKLDTVRDLVKIEFEKPEQEENSDETEDEKEIDNDTNTPTPTISKTGTVTPRPTKTVEPSETPEPSEKPEAPEDPEEEDKDVEGIQTQPMSYFDLLRNRLRF